MLRVAEVDGPWSRFFGGESIEMFDGDVSEDDKSIALSSIGVMGTIGVQVSS